MRKMFLFCLVLQIILLQGHGFIGNTPVYLANGRLSTIESLVVPNVYKKCIFVESYDCSDRQLISHRIIESGKSISPYVVRIGFDDDRVNDIICTPTQAFYRSSRQRCEHPSSPNTTARPDRRFQLW